MKQPVLGIVTLIVVVVLSLGTISLFEEATFSSWVSYLFMCLVTTQVIIGMTWQTSFPPAVGTMSQPKKGLCLTLMTVLIGICVAVFSYFVVGKGHGITPMLMIYMILTVTMTFWYTVLWHCWPVTLFTQNPLIIGLSVLVFSYFGGYLVFQLFFNFTFLQGTPVYFADADPGGMFMAWSSIIVGVTTVAVIMLFPLFEEWPVRAIKNPTVNVVVSTLIVVIIAVPVYIVATSVVGMDQIRYMVIVPVSFIFGTFIPLSFFQGELFTGTKQPVKGIVLTIICAIVGYILQRIYLYMGPVVSGMLVSGPAGNYQEEIWLANALLGLTFPLLVILLIFFQFWPLAGWKKQE